jgi:drug/metabolite transporter (DMT)-like permease
LVPAVDARHQALFAAMPAVFVLIWSTGFVVARLGMPHAPPLTFLCWRYALSIVVMGGWALGARAKWPRGPGQWGHLAVSGVLMHAGYLGGVWAAIKAGAPAGTVALIVGLQPLLTAVWVSARGQHRVPLPQWLGLLLGLAGLAAVVWHKMGGELTPANLGLTLLALGAITVGTLYQKAQVRPVDVRAGNCVQLIAAMLVSLPLAVLEPGTIDLQPGLIVAMAWSVLVLTLGGSSLLMLLIQRGAATRVTSLMYLVPPCTAAMAWLLFGEPLGVVTLAGMALCAAGVAIVLRS